MDERTSFDCPYRASADIFLRAGVSFIASQLISFPWTIDDVNSTRAFVSRDVSAAASKAGVKR